MLSECTYEMLSGTSVSRDFVDLPSQIMENWAGEPEAFKETSLFEEGTAKEFRENILEKGGTDDPMKLYLQFRGAEPNSEGMLRRKGLI